MYWKPHCKPYYIFLCATFFILLYTVLTLYSTQTAKLLEELVLFLGKMFFLCLVHCTSQCKKMSKWTAYSFRNATHHASKIMYEGFPVITTLAWKMCEKICIPPVHFDHLPTQVPTFPHCSQDLESAKNTCTFFGGLAPMDLFVSKKPRDWKFSVPVCSETWTLE